MDNFDDKMCPCCKLKEEYTKKLYLDAEDEGDIYGIVSDLVEKSKLLGFQDAILADVENKLRVLEEIDQILENDGDCDEHNCH